MQEKILYFCTALSAKLLNRRKPPARLGSILIVKLDEIGDMVTALHVFRTLHQSFPQAKMHLVAKKVNHIFFRHLNYVHCSETLPHSSFDVHIDLRGNWASLRQAWKYRPKLYLDRGSIRWKNKFNGGQRNEIDTNLEIIAPLGIKQDYFDNHIELSEEESKKVKAWLLEQGIGTFCLLHLGARDEARRWPLDRFKETVTYLNGKGIHCLLVGGKEDYALNEACLQGLSSINFNLAGTFNLLELAAFCERSSLYIGNESGPLHIAAAMNAPSIALFGPGVKNVFYPRTARIKIHHYFKPKNHRKQTAANSSILQISVEEVKQSIDELLDHV